MKRAYFFAYLLLALGFTLLNFSCKKEEISEITITILKPGPNQVVANRAAVELQVRFEASVENHNVAVLIHRDGAPSDVAFEWEEHDHDKIIELLETIDLSSYPSGTKFHLEAEACKDHDCKEKVFADIEFSIP
jgi:hypothetical protein